MYKTESKSHVTSQKINSDLKFSTIFILMQLTLSRLLAHTILFPIIFAVAVNELSLKKPISETSQANATSSCLQTYPLWLLGCGLIFREFTLQLNWMMPWILPLLDQRSPAKLLIDAVSIFLRYPLFILYCYVYL